MAPTTTGIVALETSRGVADEPLGAMAHSCSLPTLPQMQNLPGGVVTFLFTDVERSTHVWEKSPTLMAEALVQHDEAINSAVAAHNGIPIKARGEGDSWFVVAEHALDAVVAAADMQRQLSEVEWVTSPGLAVRASLHTGTADLRVDDYCGPVVNRAARLRSIAHGVQTILSGATHYESAHAKGETETIDSVLNELLGRGVESSRVPV